MSHVITRSCRHLNSNRSQDVCRGRPETYGWLASWLCSVCALGRQATLSLIVGVSDCDVFLVVLCQVCPWPPCSHFLPLSRVYLFMSPFLWASRIFCLEAVVAVAGLWEPSISYSVHHGAVIFCTSIIRGILSKLPCGWLQPDSISLALITKGRRRHLNIWLCALPKEEPHTSCFLPVSSLHLSLFSPHHPSLPIGSLSFCSFFSSSGS